MTDFAQQLKVLFYRLLFLLLLYASSRMLLYYFNNSLFVNAGIKEWFFGLRFDFASLCIVNSLFILLSLIPGKINYTKKYQKYLFWVFIIPNSLVFLANLSDVIYYRFTFKRTTFDVFDMFGQDENMLWLLPKFLFDFWYISLIFIVFIYFLRKIFLKIKVGKIYRNRHSNYFSVESFIGILLLSIAVLGFRGGFQLRPLSIIDASKMIEQKNAALLLNTPFTLIKTIGKQRLKEEHFFSEQEVKQIYSPLYAAKNDTLFQKKNVLIIIMESLSAEHCGFMNSNTKNTFTPFLDSLSKFSYFSTKCYANGKKSIDGIPAIIAGFPTLMSNPYISSVYSGNKLGSIADALKKENYTSAFFHGGNNGTMGFDNFTQSIGFEKYYGRNEFNNDNYFDGKWGIFDEEFFHYTTNTLNSMKKPFVAAIFSLSAHHPYTLPEKYIKKFKGGKLPIQKCIEYSDYSLREFFTYAKTQDWYANTLFVITADHTSESASNSQKSIESEYKIPLIFFQPNDSTLVGKNELTCQQIDILPSILDYLAFPHDYFSFGQSIFNNSRFSFSIHYKDNAYQWIGNESIIDYIDEKEIKFSGSKIRSDEELKRCKAFIQTYNKALISNSLTLKKKK